MPAILFLLPALVAQAPSATASLDGLQDLVKAMPESLVDGKASALKGQLAKARAAWDKAKPGLRKTIPEAEQAFIDRQLQSMEKMSPREKAAGALGISATLSRFQPKSRHQELLQLERTTLMAWCAIDAGLWNQMPRVVEDFTAALAKEGDRHTMAVASAREALQRFQAAAKKKQTAPAKTALKDLLELVGVLEKP